MPSRSNAEPADAGDGSLGLRQPIREATFAFVDTETTGLSPEGGSRICELAVLPVRGGLALEPFESLVNPEGPIDPGAQRVHKITQEMVAASPTFKSLAPRLHGLLSDKIVVCHNAPFDVGFLQAEFRRAGLRMPGVPVVDTLKLARKHFRFQSNSLGNIAKALGVESEGWHRAGGDARALSRVFAHFLKEFAAKGVDTVEALLAL